MKMTKLNRIVYNEMMKLHHEMIKAGMNDNRKEFENVIEKIRILVYKEPKND